MFFNQKHLCVDYVDKKVNILLLKHKILIVNETKLFQFEHCTKIR